MYSAYRISIPAETGLHLEMNVNVPENIQSSPYRETFGSLLVAARAQASIIQLICESILKFA